MSKPKQRKKQTRVASLVIYRAGDMTPRGRRDIAKWLRMHAAFLLKHGRDYSKRFTGGYNC